MCFNPLPEDTLSNLNKYEYKSTNDSFVYNNIISPCLNKVVNYLPENLAPNVITVTALVFNIIAALIAYFDGGFDFSHQMKSSTCFTIGTFQLIYYILDCLDGKQARRTGNSTPLGMIMDHGCDIFTTIITAFTLTKLLILGNDNFYSYLVFCTLLSGFYILTFEEFKVGELHFPWFSGADEGNLIVAFLGIFLGVSGPGLSQKIIFSDITFGKCFALIMFVLGIKTYIDLYVHVFQKRGFKESLKNLYQNAVIYSVMIVPFVHIYYHPHFYKEYKDIILFNASCIFARCTMELQFKIVTLDTLEYTMIYYFSNITFFLSLLIKIEFIQHYMLLFLFIIQGVELGFLIVIRFREIANYLNIRIFCIQERNVITI